MTVTTGEVEGDNRGKGFQEHIGDTWTKPRVGVEAREQDEFG